MNVQEKPGESALMNDASKVALIKGARLHDDMRMWGHFEVVCRNSAGEIVWEDEFDNLVFNAGKTELLDKAFKGTTYTATHYAGLVDGGSAPTYNAADTMASHAGWTEAVPYSNANRITIAWGTASASGGGSGTPGTGSIISSAIVFNINATATVAGVFVTTNSTKSGTTGIAISGGSFTGGNRSVLSGDTLSVTYTFNN